MRVLGLVLASMWFCGVWGQHLPVREEPLYDLGAVLLQDIPSVMGIPRDEDEWRIALRRAPDTPLRTTALWKLGERTRLTPSQGRVFATFTGYAFGKEDWETSAKATYRISGVWSVGEQALLEFVWSDVMRRGNLLGLSLPEPAPERFDTLPLARLTFRTGEWQWQFGRAPLRWAGGYSGSLLVNDTTPPVPYVKVAFPMRLPVIGRWQFEQFFASFRQSGRTVWWGGRRFERALSKQLSVSLSEAFKALQLPDGVLSQVAPYYAYQKWMTTVERGSGWFNYLAEIGVQFRLDDKNRLYLFWLTDDMRAPDFWGGRGANTPRKTALLVGARLYPNAQTRVVLEAIRTDGTRNGGVYSASGHDPRYAYAIDGYPMGHPFGANQIGFYGRLDYMHSRRWLVSLEGYNLRRFHAWYSGDRGFEFRAALRRQLSPYSFVSLHYRTRHLRNTALDPDARCGWWLEWQYRF